MSAPKKPTQQNVLPLLDPNNVPELFANELSGIQFRDGYCHFTFSVVRPKHSETGMHNNSGDNERVVTARLVLPTNTVEALLQGCEKLKTAVQLGQMTGGHSGALN